ncbi:MAG: hypothetical protein FJZ00_07235 [Candidatus Sericytochromatia bacterium]|uniref:Uncharacterized protein n=1 Tax=Candidatus Tanganyikabacteria bacterium TaxID=2961651 RepID=A0A937X2U8_9BACT|nr:hypothetical protein [Candidatus Tanganyikabacteria bacterium]
MSDRAVFPLRYAVGAALCLVVGGCQALQMGNPLLPKARLLATPNTSVTEVKITATGIGSLGSPTFRTEEPQPLEFTLRPFPCDLTPGVRINAYAVDWFDQNGSPIAGSIIPSRTQGVGLYLAKGVGAGNCGSGGGAGAAEQKVTVPVVTNPVIDFGINNGFVQSARTKEILIRQEAWPQFLTGKVTFSGRDDNGNPLENVAAFFTLKYTLSSQATN